MADGIKDSGEFSIAVDVSARIHDKKLREELGKKQTNKTITEEAMLEELVNGYEEVDQRRKEGGIYWTKLLPAQQRFFEAHSDHKVITFFAGNRSGKTYAGAASIVTAACDIHTYWKIPYTKKLFWCVSLDYKQARRTTIEKVIKLMPQSKIKCWSEQDKILRLNNGTDIDFKSAELGREHFQGVACDGIWLDEEMPKAIYDECMARLIDRAGKMLITETPLKGLTWIYDDVFLKSHHMGGSSDRIAVIQSDVYQNTYLPVQEIEAWEESMSEDEKRMRIKGEFISLSGMIYGSEWSRINPVLPAPITLPSWWRRVRVIDAGTRNPAACVWIAVDPDGNAYVYDAYQKPGLTTSAHAEEIHRHSGGINGWDHPTVIDRTAAQWKLDLSDFGIYAIDADNDQFAGLMAVKGRLEAGTLKFFPHLDWLIRDMKRLQWDDRNRRRDVNGQEKQKKVNDHGPDCVRYACMFIRKWKSKAPEGMELQRRIDNFRAGIKRRKKAGRHWGTAAWRERQDARYAET